MADEGLKVHFCGQHKVQDKLRLLVAMSRQKPDEESWNLCIKLPPDPKGPGPRDYLTKGH